MGRVFSLTSFSNELDILEIRLAELDPIVDVHIISEAPMTHQGRPKPLYLKENWARFEPWHAKIRRVQPDDMPTGSSLADMWRRESDQREAMRAELLRLDPTRGDVVLLSDADEIPSRETVERFLGQAIHILLPMHLYYANWRWREIEQNFTLCRLFPADWVRGMALSEIYRTWASPNTGLEDDLGWHMAYMGGIAAIVDKLKNTAHGELNSPEFTDRRHLEQVTKYGEDIFKRGYRTVEQVGVETLPSYLESNQERFAHLLRDLETR
jgi:hypothetical protein